MDDTQHAMGVRIRWCAAKRWTGERETERERRGTERKRKEPLVQQPEFVFLGRLKSEKKADTSAMQQVDVDSRGTMECSEKQRQRRSAGRKQTEELRDWLWGLEEAERNRRWRNIELHDDVFISATSCFSGMNSSAFWLSFFFFPHADGNLFKTVTIFEFLDLFTTVLLMI